MEEIEGKKVIYHVVMDFAKFGLTADGAQISDIADEYAVVEYPKATGGIMVYDIMVYGKYEKQGWVKNPSMPRFLIRDLLEKLGCYPTNNETE
jgi:hypothetical protein